MIETIKAIASLFPLVAVLVFFSLGLIYRKPLTAVLLNLSKLIFKRGDTELVIERTEEKSIVEIAEISEKPRELEENVAENPLTPIDSWFGKMIEAFYSKNADEAKLAFDRLKAEETDGIQRLKYEAIYHYFCYTRLNMADAINELEKLSKTQSVRSFALSQLAECYRYSRAYEKAKNALEESVKSALSDEEKATRVQSLVSIMLEMELPKEQVLEVINTAFSEIKLEHQLLYLALAEIYKKTDDNLLQSICLEKALELKPEDTDLRFIASYAQSQASLSQLAIANYDTLIRQEPDNSMAINNLGVEVDRLNMRILSAKYFKESAEKNNTLAMANLAQRYLDKGLITEADDILKNAQKLENVHANVALGISAIQKQKVEENKKWEETIQNGIKQKSFLVKFAEARFISGDKGVSFSKQWKHNNEAFEIEDKEGKIAAKWGTGSGRRKLTGEITGRSAKIDFYKQSTWTTDREYFDSGVPGLCYINNEGNKIHIMILAKDKPEFIEFDLSKG